MDFTGWLVDSDVLKLSTSKFVPIFLVLLPIFLVSFVPNSNVFNIWAHIQAYLCHKQYFSFIPILYCFERHSIRYISAHGLSVKIWQRPLTKWSAASTGLLGTTCIWFLCCCVGSRMYRGTGAKCFCSVCPVLLSSFSSVHQLFKPWCYMRAAYKILRA